MKARFRHFQHQPAFRRQLKHALRVTLGLTDTEDYVLTRLGNASDPLFCHQIEEIEYVVTIADCVAGIRLDFDTLLQANEAQNQILRALEKLEVVLKQDSRSARVETFKIPQEDQYGLGPNHDAHSRPRAKREEIDASALGILRFSSATTSDGLILPIGGVRTVSSIRWPKTDNVIQCSYDTEAQKLVGAR